MEEIGKEKQGGAEACVGKKRRFGKGIYDSKDVPIRLLDGFIAGIIGIIAVMILLFTINGGYTISFDTGGDSEIAPQKLRYGQLVKEPEIPIRPGYEFAGWYYEEDAENNWNFAASKVGGDMTLIARWEPARIRVKFDLDGGIIREGTETVETVYLQPYGTLPVPEKENSTFEGWVYSGEKITEDTIVAMPGEHVLTATWK